MADVTVPAETNLESPPYRDIAGAVARVLVSATVVVAAYFVLPLDRLNVAGSVFALVVAVLLFTLLAVFEVRTIIGARFPGLRALEALGVLVPLLLVIFAAGYYAIGIDDPAAFSESMSRLDALYFTVTTFATVGFGDITSVSPLARTVTTIQIVVNLVVLGIGVRAVVGAINYARRREQLPDA
jgi:voltage-gated potassium channel